MIKVKNLPLFFQEAFIFLHQPRESLKWECDKYHYSQFFKVLIMTLISVVHPGFGFAFELIVFLTHNSPYSVCQGALVVILPGSKDTCSD